MPLTSGNPCSLKELLYFAGRPSRRFVVIAGFPVANFNIPSKQAAIDKNPCGAFLYSSRIFQAGRAEKAARLGDPNGAGDRQVVGEVGHSRGVRPEDDPVEFACGDDRARKLDDFAALTLLDEAPDGLHMVEGDIGQAPPFAA